MGLCLTSHHTEFSHIIHAPLSRVIEIIKDPITLIHFNPLVVKVVQNAEDAALYEIDDLLHIFGFIPMKVHYKARFTYYGNDGTELPTLISDSDSSTTARQILSTKTEAAVWTETCSLWKVKKIDDETCQIIETVEVTGLIFLMSFIKTSLESSHRVLCEAIARKAEGRDA